MQFHNSGYLINPFLSEYWFNFQKPNLRSRLTLRDKKTAKDVERVVEFLNKSSKKKEKPVCAVLDVSNNWMELRQNVQITNSHYSGVSNLNQPGFSKKTKFQFNSVFAPFDDQVKVFKRVAMPEIQRLFDGKSECGLIFAYGYTNSGKTYSVLGDMEKVAEKRSHAEILGEPTLGLIPRIFRHLLEIKENGIGERVVKKDSQNRMGQIRETKGKFNSNLCD